MAGMLAIGLSGLTSAQSGLLTAEHNIANAGTAGYHRQEVQQRPALPLPTGSGFLGQGVEVETVRRVYSQFLDKQLMNVETSGSYLDKFYAEIRQIDNMLADPNAGLSPALQDFFSGVQAVANTPSSLPARQVLLSNASSLVSRFDSIDQRLTELRTGVNSQLVGMVSEINSYAAQIAEVNDQIGIMLGSSGFAHQPNDLLDQRDKLISDLNKLVKVSVLAQTDGSYNIFIGSGQPLVVGTRSFDLTATQSKEDPNSLVLSYAAGELKSSLLSGGSLGALLAFRETSLDLAQNSLGRVATTLVEKFNAQHKLGMDLNGALGTNFFSALSPSVAANMNNTAGAAVTATISTIGNLTTSNYRLTYDGAGNWSLLNMATNAAVAMAGAGTVGNPFVADGLSFVVTPPTTATNTANFLIMPTRYAARDISLALTNASTIAAAIPVKTTATTQSESSTAAITALTVDTTFVSLAAPVTITYDGATGRFTPAPAQIVKVTVGGVTTSYASGTPFLYTSGATISFGGANNTAVSFVMSGTPVSGDVFTIEANTGGVADGRNALALGALQTTNTMANNTSGTPTTTFQGAYSQMVSEVGSKAREMQVRSKAQEAMVAQTKQEQQSLSGVNLDEEAANLIRFQQAYQASGKAMQIASSLFATLLDLGN